MIFPPPPILYQHASKQCSDSMRVSEQLQPWSVCSPPPPPPRLKILALPLLWLFWLSLFMTHRHYSLTSSRRHVRGTSHCLVCACDLPLAHRWQRRSREILCPQGRAQWDYDVICVRSIPTSFSCSSSSSDFPAAMTSSSLFTLSDFCMSSVLTSSSSFILQTWVQNIWYTFIYKSFSMSILYCNTLFNNVSSIKRKKEYI